MVINEKVLVRELKEAFKGWGYCVMVMPGDRWVFKTPDWTVAIEGRNNVPREVLSLIVLHMGDLPRERSANRIYKLEKTVNIQKEVYDVAEEEFRKLEKLSLDTDPVEVRRTKLILGRRQVWQQVEDRKILMMDPRYAGIMERTGECVIQSLGTAFYLEGEISSVYIFKCRDNDNQIMVEHLEKLQWI